MNEFPKAMVSESAPLPRLSDETARDWQDNLALRGYDVRHGLTPADADTISVMATQPHIKKYCPKDATEARFGSRESAEQWLARDGGKAVFVLLNTEEQAHRRLVGYGWTARRRTPEVPGGETTFAIRIGQEGRRRHLALAFASLIIAGTQDCYDARNFWLETWGSNQPAVRTYRALGFEPVKSVAAAVGVKDHKPRFDARLFMALPSL